MISLIVPCYNEQRRLSIPYWHNLFLTHADVNFLFVDDGSKDETLKILNSFETFPNVKVLALISNSGKGEAVRQGFLDVFQRTSLSDTIVGFLDCDGAFGHSDILAGIELSHEVLVQGNYEALISSRVKMLGRKIERSELRHFIGRMIATLISIGWNESPYDSQSGFKMFLVTDNLQRIFSKEFKTKWFFDLEILSALQSGSIYEYPLNQWTEINGSHLDFTSAPRIISEVLKIRRIIKTNRKEWINGPHRG
jgi:dolichyl-phosphate beta-glucosyltransferase